MVTDHSAMKKAKNGRKGAAQTTKKQLINETRRKNAHKKN
jgi:hypothetical protein